MGSATAQIDLLPGTGAERATILWEALASVPSEVRRLFASDPANPFLNPDWMGGYWQATQRGHERLAVIGVYGGEAGLIAAAAFRYHRRFGTAHFRFLAEGRADYGSFAGEQSPEVFVAILDRLRLLARSGAVRFSDVVAHSPLAGFLAAQRGAVQTELYPAPYRDLGAPRPPNSDSNRKFQSRIPSYIRRLEVLGPVTLDVLDFDGERERSLAALPALFAIHDLRHAGRRNAWKKESNREFLRRFASTAEQSNLLGFVTRLDGVPVAFDLGFRAGERFVLYIPAFHSSFEKFRLGHINRYLTFEKCAELGITHYDFSRGDSFAKRVWSTGARDNLEFCLPLASGPGSRIATTLLAAPNVAKAFLRRRKWNEPLGRLVERVRPEKHAAPDGSGNVPGSLWDGAQPLRYSLIQHLGEGPLTQIAESLFSRNGRQSPAAEWTGPGVLRLSDSDASRAAATSDASGWAAEVRCVPDGGAAGGSRG